MMELELKTMRLDGFDRCAEQVLTQEETAETIVPDYCPDIARIIATEGKVFLHSRELHDGKGEAAGTVRVTVLYSPDGESGIRTLEFAMPFTFETDGRAMGSCTQLCASAEIESLETRSLNPRKVFTSCKLAARFTGYAKCPLTLSYDAEGPEDLCLEKKLDTRHVSVLTQIVEKDAAFSDELDLSPGREGAAEILFNRISASVGEQKIVGNKLIAKGLFRIQLLYRSVSGRFCSAGGELPFSQIFEIADAGENAAADVHLYLTGTDVQLSSSGEEDGRRIAVTVYFHAAALIRQERPVTLLADLYSTSYDIGYEALPLTLTDRADTFTRRQNIREIMETGISPESLLVQNVSCGSVSVGREGALTVLRAPVTIRSLYLDEGGAPLLAERSTEVSCQLDLPDDSQIAVQAYCPEDVQGSIGDRGIEVRLPVEFRIQLVTRKKSICLSSAKLLSDAPKNLSAAPSLALRRLGADETLWMLAKHYNTTIQDILTANMLESEEEITPESLLLIPKKRV